MNVEIFFALIGLPLSILAVALLCYVHTGIKEEIASLKQEIRARSFSNDGNRKGDVS
ncbi:hypothetical protein P4637_07080 [Halalkalibacterium halodurans]|uniref:BH2707 protein n=1 Tax=Halalkalibacterium halodurans (strain ATCC BAA-125 / DSM 18197 / FERM 7344 / JCM 9153 / C-125) TaxID=272558 RepID=Q9K9E1_HALH5|nr:hypothetical protein [Halalkalibacterium halodurans]MED4080305.1 hypothetical protein [Halalkalibacterium halodurans]MED4084627.1 hypothetical protein [Halalkalibacterium halodurans]MED4103993.1 hypothetical protein [Halalkalibacterium halodurans]MED4108935.1 hypothetical protein [Halalkalibacterium halodurans]MED4125255.1 hypothetical protein [Halalkalibacterium halodurans]